MTYIGPNAPPLSYGPPSNAGVDEKTLSEPLSRIALTQKDERTLPPAGQLDNALSSSPDLSPGEGVSFADLGVDSSKLEQKLTQIEQILRDSGVDKFLGLATDIEALAKILVKQAFQARETALKQKQSSLENARNELLNQASKQNDAASALHSSAVKAMVLGVVSAAVSIGGAMMQFRAAGKSAMQSKKLHEENPNLHAELKQNHELQAAHHRNSKLGEGVKPEEGSAPWKDQKNIHEDGRSLDQLREHAAPLESLSRLKQVEQSRIDADLQLHSGKFQGVGAAGQALNQGANFSSTEGQAISQKEQAEGSVFAAMSQEQQQDAEMKKSIYDRLDDLVKAIIEAVKEMEDLKAQELSSIRV